MVLHHPSGCGQAQEGELERWTRTDSTGSTEKRMAQAAILWKLPPTPFTSKAVFYSKTQACLLERIQLEPLCYKVQNMAGKPTTKPHSLPPPWKCGGICSAGMERWGAFPKTAKTHTDLQ